jgi:hypothetical protein
LARGRTVLWAVLLGLVLGGQAHADMLVVFQNGRTLRVESVRDEGQWLFLTLGKKSEMGVLARLISSVDEIEGEAPAQLPNVVSPAGGSGGASVNRGGTVGSRVAGSQRPPRAPRQSPMEQVGNDDAEQRAEADLARNDALTRAAARAGRSSKIGLVPGTAPSQEENGDAANADLSNTNTPDGWRSLLDDSRGGRSGRQRDDEPRQDDEDPER